MSESTKAGLSGLCALRALANEDGYVSVDAAEAAIARFRLKRETHHTLAFMRSEGLLTIDWFRGLVKLEAVDQRTAESNHGEESSS